jgi:beta-glucanase (GH16 family)
LNNNKNAAANIKKKSLPLAKILKIQSMRTIISIFLLINLTASAVLSQSESNDSPSADAWKLVWSDEFNQDGKPDSAVWNYENGFVRNEEFQWYTPDNASCHNGCLIIEGRRELRENPRYKAESNNWRSSRKYAEYTSSSLNTRGRKEFMFMRLEVKARIDTAMGLWPAIWTLGKNGEWPSNGEIDIMESYPTDGIHYILANVATGTPRRYVAKWDTRKIPLDYFLQKDALWAEKFHVWRMDWDETAIRLYLDEELLNETLLTDMLNPDGSQPFQQPHYILLNLAIGGQNGGDPSNTRFPTRYEIDYVRVYQRK